VRVGGGKRTERPLGFADSSGSGFGQVAGCPSEHMPIPDGMRFRCNMGGGILSNDGKWFHVAFGSHPAVLKYDMETLTPVLSVELASVGLAYGLTASPDGGHFYVSIMEGRHRRSGTSNIKTLGFAGDIQLVKLEAETLTEVGRVTLAAATATGVVRDLSITADGTRGAIAIDWRGEVAYVDLENMTVIQTINTTELRSRIATITPDGSNIYVFYNAVADGEIYDTSGFGATPLPILAAGGGSAPRLGVAIFGPDGRLYLAGRPLDGSAALTIFDPVDPFTNQIPLYTGNQMLAVTFNRDGTLLYGKTNGDQMTVLDVATDTLLDTVSTGTETKGHSMSVTQ
jgi:DNA-binding beta-propeller fold protein YncE